MRQLISRSEAKRKKLKHYYTGKPCKRGHTDLRRVSSHTCIGCEQVVRDSRKDYHANWQRKNADKISANNKRYRDANREKARAYNRRWCADNPDKMNAATAKRRAIKANATPPWADHDKIREFYTEAARLTRVTGVPHEVDHIIPLQNEFVCGLHVHQNLQILTAKENRSKSNKF